MKKKLLLGSGAIVVLLLGLFGRELVGFLYLLKHVENVTEAYQAVGPWPQVVDDCNGCHGAQGSSLHQRYPSLAAQPAEYLRTQLQRFASGERTYPTMQPLAKTLSAAEISQIVAYYAGQPALENRWFRPDPQLRGRGETLAGACMACHGEKLMGQGAFPRLAGQGVDYLRVQLDAFAEGRRVDPSGAMAAITAGLTPDDRQALAHYLAALAPTAR
ncbi:c-type cytochrome [Pseudomonas aeruginosa]|uniref:c-type cytochrome n=1 Tax=Pseudomonas aeruginosa TaxID=287 RepID=UPI001CBAA0FD|nr:c-type cytochrome [Pseudomonas aeruginosa]MBX5597392.1 c-type cytochrome [Pseudomonas aeruginosa]MDI2376521.1 c-type cytochrome [Pseudomonas aeruginosa]MDI2382274.1 c-type cytochrome [Pseudomonas aeruginosa]